MTGTELLFAAGILIVGYQLWVSVQLLRYALYDRTQKGLQLVLVWLIPIIGAALVQAMMKSEGKPPYKPEKGYTQPGDSAS